MAEKKAEVQGTVPRALSITARHMVLAYVHHDRRQQKRIEEWGRINQQTLAGMGAQLTEQKGSKA